MVNGAFFFDPAPCNLGLQRGDARIEFGDRQRIEILSRQRAKRIVGFAGEDLVQVHAQES